MVATDYVHGYSAREEARLLDQAGVLEELLHHDTRYAAGSRVLEAGCGVGAQTVPLARNSPGASIVSVDVSQPSLDAACARVAAAGVTNVELRREDLFALPFEAGAFDHVFVCFVLEHLAAPLDLLRALKPLLRPGGSITVIEGDHGSTYFHPESAHARRAIQCLVDLQAQAGGDSMIGRRLHPLMLQAGFPDVRVTPRMVYADASRPAVVEGFTRNTFAAMVEGVRAPALAAGMIEAAEFDRGVADLYRTAQADGTFCYCFFKAVATRTA